MNFQEKKVSDIQIAYIGGGSRLWAWRLMADLALEPNLSGTVRLYDINLTAAEENETMGNSLLTRDDAPGKWQYRAVQTIEEALTGVDFVILSILPGTFQEMISDVHAPEKYGIYQSVGDTVGPGGLMRSLRTIPLYVGFAENIKQHCPNAWVINYTNPMTLCTRTLYEVFPQIKAFGCCHEVFNTQKLLAAMVEEMQGLSGIAREDIKVNVLGINHFTWFDKATYQEIDLFPLYREFADKYYETGFQIPDEETWQQSPFRYMHRVKFDLFKRYGLIGAAGDRHLAEFCPPWYLKDPETIREWKFNITTLEYRINRLEKQNQTRKEVISGAKAMEIVHSGEEGVRQIKALLGLEDIVTNVNLPNEGQLAGVPQGAVVETNAYFSRNSIRPVVAGKMPEGVNGLVVRHVYNQETIIKAALRKDKDLAFQAFVNDPLVTIGLKDAKALFHQMLQNTKEYLPGWNI